MRTLASSFVAQVTALWEVLLLCAGCPANVQRIQTGRKSLRKTIQEIIQSAIRRWNTLKNPMKTS